MTLTKADLILHPVRLRILQTLMGDELTTQEITERLGDVPQSSIYRHLKLLLAEGMIEIAAAHLINGIQEKTYGLAQRPYLNAEEMAGMTAAQHGQYFATYVLSLWQEFQQYLTQKEASGSPLNLEADRVGYTTAAFYATVEEFDQVAQALNQAIAPLLQNEPGTGRHRHKLAVVTHPVDPLTNHPI